MSPPPTYSLHDIGRMLFDMNIQFAKQDEELLTQELELEAIALKQHVFNTRIEETMAKLAAIFRMPKEPTDPPATATTTRGWKIPPSLTQAPPGVAPEALPRLRFNPPRFDGDNTPDWIHKIQNYYNHQYMPFHDRLYLTQYLFDHLASEWMANLEENNKGKGWDDFLLAVKDHFDPDPYEDYVGSDGNFKNRIVQQAPIISNEFHDEDMAGDGLPISVTNDVVVYNNGDADVVGRKAFTLASSILKAATDSCDTGDVLPDVCFETHNTTTTTTTTDIMIIGNIVGNLDAHLVDIKTESHCEQTINRKCDGFVSFRYAYIIGASHQGAEQHA